MTLDTMDRAFVARWQARRSCPAVTTEPVAPAEAISSVPEPEPELEEEEDSTPASVTEAPLGDLSQPEVGAPPTAQPNLVDRLLEAGREEWECLADELEIARRDGHRVIAVIGGEPGEGRSTLVECLERTLRERGRDVVVLTSAENMTEVDGTPADGGRLHDRRIVLVDAGIWFPPGPIRRQKLITESVGCDAAILVRRADREPVSARATALAALGMTVLGEVVTFAPAAGDT